jgi:hypothetical protein
MTGAKPDKPAYDWTQSSKPLTTEQKWLHSQQESLHTQGGLDPTQSGDDLGFILIDITEPIIIP